MYMSTELVSISICSTVVESGYLAGGERTLYVYFLPDMNGLSRYFNRRSTF